MLPIFPAGVSHITPELAFKTEDGMVTYFNATMPVFQHSESDLQSFKMIVSQFYVMGVVKQSELVRAFGVNELLIKRAVKTFREHGPQGFFTPRRQRGPGVLTEGVRGHVQDMLDQGKTPGDVSQHLGLKVDTIRKAILNGRLHRPSSEGVKVPWTSTKKKTSSKSERSAEDSDAEMG
jgi:hypothetical protein